MIGKVLKIAAWVMMFFGIIGSIVIGVVLGDTFEEFYWIIPVGILSSIVTGLLMLGFGELIEKANEIADNTHSFSASAKTSYVPTPVERFSTGKNQPVNNVYKEDLISEKKENYQMEENHENGVYNGLRYETKNTESRSKKTAARLQGKTPGVTICSNCGREQHTDKKMCWYCDAVFEENNQQG